MESHKCKVRIVTPVEGVFQKYQPKVGMVYDAEYSPQDNRGKHSKVAVCIVDILDKRICLKKGEYEILAEA